MSEKVLRWLFFSVGISLLPLAFDFFIVSGHQSSGRLPTLAEIVGRGELCLIAATISGVAVGEMIAVALKHPRWGIVLSFFSFVSFGLNSVIYTVMKSSISSSPNSGLITVSIFLLVATVVLAASCISLAEATND